MKKDYLSNTINGTSNFSTINNRLLDWDYGKIHGKGLWKKYTGHYAHIELSIYESIEDNPQNQVIWNIENAQMPEQRGFRPIIEKVLSFFIDYAQGVKGESNKLTFEINDGSYHLFDTRKKDFELVTIFALVNAFDMKFRPISPKNREFIEKCKIDAVKWYNNYDEWK